MTVKIHETYLSISVYFAAAVTFALLFFPKGSILPALMCCIIHEAGHLLMIHICHGSVRKISLGAYGMRIEPASTLNISPKNEIFISLAGPMMNIAIALVGLFLKIDFLIRINLGLCFFNLMPAVKTDGYTALNNLLILKLEKSRAEAVLKKISTAFLIIMYLFGAAVLIKTKYNFSFLAVAVYITIINTEKTKQIIS